MDAAEFEQLVDRYQEPLFRFALSLCRNEPDACDLTQQTFYLWATKGHQLRDASKVKSWLFTTLYRDFISSRRRSARFPHFEVELVEHELPSIAPDQVEAMDGGVVTEALLQVDELYRAAVVLFYLEEHSYREIAEILEIPIGTVMSRLSRGKQQLRQILGDSVNSLGRKIIPLTGYPQSQSPQS